MARSLKYLLDIAFCIVIYVILLRKWKNHKKTVVAADTLMFLYLIAVLFVTLMPIIASLPYAFSHSFSLSDLTRHLTPFNDYLHHYGDAERQIVLNTIMTMPFGFLLPVCSASRGKICGFVKCVLFTAGLSITIEILQPLIHGTRSADITDVIMNTAGGILGYLIFIILRPITLKLIKYLDTKWL